MIPAVSYLRMSKESQEASIPAQRAAVAAMAKTRGYVIIREYSDSGISGDSTEKRFGFQQMMTDVAKGDFRAVLCWDQDRFGRFDPLECGFWIKPMRDAGVVLVTVAQGEISWDDFAGRIVFLIQQDAKHQFLRDLSRNSNRGKLEAAKQGRWMGSVPYGYKLGPDQHLVPVSPQAEVVKEIFRRYANGETMRAIAAWMTAAGHGSPKSSKWNVNAVCRIVRNRAYLGHSRFNHKSAGKYTSIANGVVIPKKNQKAVFNDPSLWIITENTHPPLVDPETFQRSQSARSRNRNFKTKKTTHPVVFRGLLICGHCGSTMHALYVPAQKDVVYMCSQYNMNNSCNPNRTYQIPLVAMVNEVIQKQRISKSGLDEIRALVTAHFKPMASQQVPVSTIQKQLASTKKKLSQAEDRLLEVPTDMIAIIAGQIRELRDLAAEQEGLLARAKEPAESVETKIQETIATALASCRLLSEQLSQEPSQEMAAALQAAISKILVWSSKYAASNQPNGKYQIDRIEVYDKFAEFLR